MTEIIVEQSPEYSRDSEATVRQIVSSLVFLQDNVHFKRFVSKIIELEISKRNSQLAKEIDPVEMYRLQGDIRSLKKSADIKSWLKNYNLKLRTYGKGKE